MSYMGSWSIEQPLSPYYPRVRETFAVFLSVYDPTAYNFHLFMRKQELWLELISLLKKLTKEVRIN